MFSLAESNVVDVFWRRVEQSPDKPAVLYKTDGQFRTVKWSEHGAVVEKLAAALIKHGIMAGDKVGILCQNRPHWTWADLSILSAQAVTVPIYPTLAASEVSFLVTHSDVVAVFVENDRQLEKLIESGSGIPDKLKLVILIEGVPPATTGDATFKILAWQDFLSAGEAFLQTDRELVLARRRSIDPDTIATIVYTSGTTGVPKGAIISHSNIYAVLAAMSQLVDYHEDDLALSFLPLSHVYERVGGQFLAVYLGVPFAYAESMEKVPDNLMELKPTVLNAVPRFYEKAYARVQGQIRHMPPAQQAFIRWAISIGRRATKQKMEAKVEPALLNRLYRAELRVADRIVFRRIRERFGGRLRMMTSGAAPLSNDVHIFFEAIGMPIIEGYGLTETCAPLSCNTLKDNKFRSVGKPLEGVQVKLAEDGELLVKGPNVFLGYYKNEEATNAAFDDGWFKTGDIAQIDENGYIYITDRKKDIIITAGGKHVAPQFIESLFKNDPLVAHVVAYGDRRKYITALITLNHDALLQFAKSKSIIYSDIHELFQNPTVRKEVERIVHDKNQSLARFQRIKKFAILETEFTIEANDLTPTLKVKRKAVTQKYQAILDGMYESEDLEAQQQEQSVEA